MNVNTEYCVKSDIYTMSMRITFKTMTTKIFCPKFFNVPFFSLKLYVDTIEEACVASLEFWIRYGIVVAN